MPGGQPHPGPHRPEDPCPPESYAVLLGRHCAFRSYVADPLRFVNFYPGLGPISPESPCNARKRVGICMHRCQIHPVMLHARYAPQSTPRGPSALRPDPSVPLFARDLRPAPSTPSCCAGSSAAPSSALRQSPKLSWPGTSSPQATRKCLCTSTNSSSWRLKGVRYPSSPETIAPLGWLYIDSGRHWRSVKTLEGRPKVSNGTRPVMKRQTGTRI